VALPLKVVDETVPDETLVVVVGGAFTGGAGVGNVEDGTVVVVGGFVVATCMTWVVEGVADKIILLEEFFFDCSGPFVILASE
jgi:hypothetical protein